MLYLIIALIAVIAAALASTAYSLSIFSAHKAALIADADMHIAFHSKAQTEDLDASDMFDRVGSYEMAIKYRERAVKRADLIAAAMAKRAEIVKASAIHAATSITVGPLARVA